MGGTNSDKCNDLAENMWEFWMKVQAWISVEQTPYSRPSIAWIVLCPDP